VPNHPRLRRIAIAGARAQLASTIADVVNLSRTGALIHTPCEQERGAHRPLQIEFNETGVHLTVRVVRCEPARTPPRRMDQEFAVGVAFVHPSEEAEALVDKICCQAASLHERRRRLYVSLARRCPHCKSRAVIKQSKHRYACADCSQHFAGIRIGIVRFAV
jgi:DNA-directed RNA polymerase subunit RPC12/RpoP